MHEIGIVSGILTTVRDAAREAGASRVVSVCVRIGDMREVVPESLDFAWDVLCEDDPMTCSAELVVEEVHPRSRCLVCGEEFCHDRFHMRCPACRSADTRIEQGRELDLVSMEIEVDD
ncbi:MAG: hydrogenase maturation nickel metallochaperone HypA [Coriobacteriaceae bacterium]|nr:hydrogenase maturation nickel metallochaperone HypA [Coriobacteriaceae bacterium]